MAKDTVKKQTVAIVCGGGPAPGINGVISAVTAAAHLRGWKVLGIYDGFSRLAKREQAFIELDDEVVSRIHRRGGNILRMSRYNPTKNEDDLKAVVETLQALGVNYLVTIGGDDTAFSAATVSNYAKAHGGKIHSVHVPKTIDNDLPLPEGVPTFGFETARALGATEVQNLLEDARTSSNRWYFVVAMGRTAGHLALGIGTAAAAPLTVIPEEFGDREVGLQEIVDIVAGAVMKSLMAGRPYGVAVVAEGVMEKIAEADLKKLGNVKLDEHGHIWYAELNFGGIMKGLVEDEVKRLGHKITVVGKDIGYELRCADPIPYDVEYTRALGFEAVQFLAHGGTGAMISIQNNEAVPMKFEDIKDKKTGKTAVRRVNVESMKYKVARSLMTRLTADDLKDADLAKFYGLTKSEFKKKYEYLFK